MSQPTRIVVATLAVSTVLSAVIVAMYALGFVS
jgi:hypothetical protein